MKRINEVVKKEFGHYPERILQFGEGNFLRAFVDWMVETANKTGVYEGSIVLCQPITQGLSELLNAQDNIYTLIMRGMEEGKAVERTEVITSVSRCINPYEDYESLLSLARSADLEVIVSNTTEAGITYHAWEKMSACPNVSFPAKITAFLYERYLAFEGSMDKGLLFLPVELIDYNGRELKRIVLTYAQDWNLPEEFIRWVQEANEFASTLVDRIVTGYPRDEIADLQVQLGYEDHALVTSELFHLWVIEGDIKWADKLPLHLTDAHVIWTDDVTPYKKRKVRILNGAHTATVLASYLAGHETVLDFMQDPLFKQFLERTLQQEIIPTLDLPKEELDSFAAAVSNRFLNPYIRHRLLDISLNSCSKFTARCLPSFLGYYVTTQHLPEYLTFSLAAFFHFYHGEWIDGIYTGNRKDGSLYPIRDDVAVLELFTKAFTLPTTLETVDFLLSQETFWNGMDLSQLPSLSANISCYLEQFKTQAMSEVLSSLLEKIGGH